MNHISSAINSIGNYKKGYKKAVFYPKYFILTSLPLNDIKRKYYTKINNKVSLEVTCDEGIPNGTIARRILLYLTTQFTIQKSNKIKLGSSFSSFMKGCGYDPTGGNNGNINRFKEQLKRLTLANFKIKDLKQKEVSFCFKYSSTDEGLFIEVSEEFYNHLMKNKIVVNKTDIDKLSGKFAGSNSFDIYMWLVYKRHITKKSFTKLSYHNLYNQIGSSSNIYQFKFNVKKALSLIAILLNFKTFEGNKLVNLSSIELKIYGVANLLKLFRIRKYNFLIPDSRLFLSQDQNWLIFSSQNI